MDTVLDKYCLIFVDRIRDKEHGRSKKDGMFLKGTTLMLSQTSPGDSFCKPLRETRGFLRNKQGTQVTIKSQDFLHLVIHAYTHFVPILVSILRKKTVKGQHADALFQVPGDTGP
jgi:hypothetical protein